jgi:hypothetical protein
LAYGLNDLGEVVGAYISSDGSAEHGLIYKNGKFTTLDFPGSSYTALTGVNNSGDIVGIYYNPGSNLGHGFLFHKGTFSTIDYPGAQSTTIYGINSSGVIVGFAELGAEFHGFVDVNGKFTLIDGPGAESFLTGVNDNATLVGNSLTGGRYSGFVAVAQPPPAPTGLADASIHGGFVNAANNTAAQTLTGHAEADTSIAVFDGTTMLGATTTDGSGDWSFTLGHLADGAHSLKATATDSLGATSPASAPLTFTVDTKAPVPEVLYINRAGANWAVVGLTEANSQVALFDHGAQIGVAAADSRGVWSITVPLNPATLHDFAVLSMDPAGSFGASTGDAFFSLTATSLSGGAGNDVLIAWGSDTLTGGPGADRFVVDAAFTHRTITDFSPAQHDVLELDASAYHNFAWVLANSAQVGADTVITVHGDQLVLASVTRTSLHASDFIFA